MTEKHGAALKSAVEMVMEKDDPAARKLIDPTKPRRCDGCGWNLNIDMLQQMVDLPVDRGYGMAFMEDGELQVHCPRCVTYQNLRHVMEKQDPPLIDKEMNVPLITLNMTSGMRVARTSTTPDPAEVLKAVENGEVDPLKHAHGDEMMILQFIVDKERDHAKGNGPKSIEMEDGVYPDNALTVAAIAMSKVKSVAVAIRILHEWLPVETADQLMKLGELAIKSKKGLQEAEASDMSPSSMLAILKSMARMGSPGLKMPKETSHGLDALLEILEAKGVKSHDVIVADSPEEAVEGLKGLIKKIEGEHGLEDDEEDETIGFLSKKKGGGTVH